MAFRFQKIIRILPFLSVNLNRAGATAGRHNLADSDSGPPTTSILDPERQCDRCEHFGGWFPVRMDDQIDYNAFGGCVRPGASKIISLPKNECAFWVKSRINPKRPRE